jgi:hypothetical protein
MIFAVACWRIASGDLSDDVCVDEAAAAAAAAGARQSWNSADDTQTMNESRLFLQRAKPVVFTGKNRIVELNVNKIVLRAIHWHIARAATR